MIINSLHFPYNASAILDGLSDKINLNPIEPLTKYDEPWSIAANTLTIYMVYLLFHL